MNQIAEVLTGALWALSLAWTANHFYKKGKRAR